MIHKPVLKKEVLQYLDPKPNENFIDATVGEGGHALEILKKTAPWGKLLGIDLEKKQIYNSRFNLADVKERVILKNDSYSNIKNIVLENRFGPVDGVLLDLGFSSWHLEESGKGFSFNKDEPLDMRYSDKNGLTAEKIINEYPEHKVEKILREFGEEKFSKQIARKIAAHRKTKKIKNTLGLVNIIRETLPGKFHHGKIHLATRSFQALRIAVNEELDKLKEFLPQAIEILSVNGRIVIISFHSLEDRIVKNFFKGKEKLNQVKILNKKPILASNEELLENPRARSAKLRAITKIK